MNKDNWSSGVLLKKNKVKEKGVFLVVFTKQFGKKSFYVGSVAKSKKNYASYFSLGNEIEFEYTKRGGLCIIKETKLISEFKTSDYNALQVLTYGLQLVDAFCMDEYKNDEVYSILTEFLDAFKYNIALSRICLAYEIKLLKILGFISSLNTYFHSGKKIDLGKNNYFDLLHGGVMDEIEAGKNKKLLLEASMIKILHFFETASFRDLGRLDLSFEDSKQLLLLFRQLIMSHCGKKKLIEPCFLSENLLK